MLPDFTRVAWSSPQAQSVWSDRIRRVSQAWEQIERLSVKDGLRSAALQNIAPEAMPGISMWAASVGLYCVILDRVGVGQSYAASHVPLTEGKGWAVRAAICTPSAAMRWPDAWLEKDDEAMGRMLGFPSCCRQFFARTWGKGLVDTTWEMGPQQGQREVNVLLRWLGIRAVTHLPCSFTCESSAEIGKAFIACGRQHGFSQEMAWLCEMLDWPVEWSALNGIAEIVTPVCRVQTRTNLYADRKVIQRAGTTYPAEGARGVRFPFTSDPVMPVRLSVSRGISQPKDRAQASQHQEVFSTEHAGIVDPREWTDNGFQSRAAMDAAHAMLLKAIEGRTFRCVVDLGCGNGELIRQIPARRRVGVESEPKRAHTALKRADHVYNVDCTDAPTLLKILRMEQPDLIIAQARRNPPEMFQGYRVLSYSYDEPAFARLIQVPERVTA